MTANWTQGLTEHAGAVRSANGSAPITDEDVKTFAAQHNQTTRPGALTAIVKAFRLWRDGKQRINGRIEDLPKGPLNRHDAEFSALCMAARDCRLDKIAFHEIDAELQKASHEECDRRGEVFDPVDYAHSRRDAIRYALAEDIEELRKRDKRGTEWFDATKFQTNGDSPQTEVNQDKNREPWERYQLITARELAESVKPALRDEWW